MKTFRARPLPQPLNVEIRSYEELRAYQEGLRLFVRNLKAAQGTAKGLGDTEVVDRWEAEVEWLESTVLPKVQEQQDLGMGSTPIEREIEAAAPAKTPAADEDEPWDQGPQFRVGGVAADEKRPGPIDVDDDDPDGGVNGNKAEEPASKGKERMMHRRSPRSR